MGIQLFGSDPDIMAEIGSRAVSYTHLIQGIAGSVKALAEVIKD